MPKSTGRGRREFLPSANQALAALEEATGKPVLIVDAPELNVLATIRRAGPQDSSHVLRIKGRENRLADYLIVFQCRMALREGQGARAVLRDKPAVRDQVISECEELHSHLPLASPWAASMARQRLTSSSRRAEGDSTRIPSPKPYSQVRRSMSAARVQLGRSNSSG